MTRAQAEKYFGPIKTAFLFPPIPTTAYDWRAHFERYDDGPDTPRWAIAWAKTEAEAIGELLVQAQEHLDDMRVADLERKSGV